MAISQFYMAVIPNQGIIEFFGEIPKVLEVDFKKRAEKFLNDTIEDEDNYFEFIQHKCWSITKFNSKEIISIIDQKLDRANWGNNADANNWKTESNNVDNDAWLLTDEENNIIEFTFRADLRQHQLKFLVEMIGLCNRNELLLMDSKGHLVSPDIENVIGLIKKSNAFKFVVNPNKFFTDLENGSQ